jgi:hypothetical protein
MARIRAICPPCGETAPARRVVLPPDQSSDASPAYATERAALRYLRGDGVGHTEPCSEMCGPACRRARRRQLCAKNPRS